MDAQRRKELLAEYARTHGSTLDQKTALLLAEYEHARKIEAYKKSQEARVRKQRIAYIEAVQGYPFGKRVYLLNDAGKYVPKNRPLKAGEQAYVKTKISRRVQVTRADAERFFPEVWEKKNGVWVLAQNLDSPGPYWVTVEADMYKKWSPLGVERPPGIIRVFEDRSYSLQDFLKEQGFRGKMTRAEAAALFETLPIVYAPDSQVRAAERWEAEERTFPEKALPVSERRAEEIYGPEFWVDPAVRLKEALKSPAIRVGKEYPAGAVRINAEMTKPEWFPTRRSLRREEPGTWLERPDPAALQRREERMSREREALTSYLARYR